MNEVSGFVSLELSEDGEYVNIANGGKYYEGYQRRYFSMLDGDADESDTRLKIVLDKASGYRDEILQGKRVNVHVVWTLTEDRRYYDKVYFDRVEVVDAEDW